MPRPVCPGILRERPYSGYVDLDGFVDYVKFIELIDNLQSLVDSFDVKSEVVCFEDGAGLEPLGDACLTVARARSVASLSYPPERALSKGVVELMAWKSGVVGVVVSAAIKLTSQWSIDMVSVNATRASRYASTLGELVG